MRATLKLSMVSIFIASSKSCLRRNGAAAFSSSSSNLKTNNPQTEELESPWVNDRLPERAKGKNPHRARQHVNPLASKFQQRTILTPDWPRDVFDDMTRPLFLDIGCSRGGFLVDIAKESPDDYNYLGLEIRPIVVYHAQRRVEKHSLTGKLDFVGCNANVDLERLLTHAEAQDKLKMVAIQFPDPHFKKRHAKRRVTTPELVRTLAQFMPEGATVFLQSDIQSVLDGMRLQFREQPLYFKDQKESLEDYVEKNIVGIPTEREISVLEKGLPVYRAVFTRTAATVVDDGKALKEE
jgi:tRNA (guanine-N7-)-methyltransferase